MARRTAVDYEKQTMTVCGNKLAGQRDLDEEAARWCLAGTAPKVLRCSQWSEPAAVTGSGAIVYAGGDCCDYTCR